VVVPGRGVVGDGFSFVVGVCLLVIVGVGGVANHANVVRSRWWDGGSQVRSLPVESVAFVVADVDEVW